MTKNWMKHIMPTIKATKAKNGMNVVYTVEVDGYGYNNNVTTWNPKFFGKLVRHSVTLTGYDSLEEAKERAAQIQEEQYALIEANKQDFLKFALEQEEERYDYCETYGLYSHTVSTIEYEKEHQELIEWLKSQI